MKKKLKSFGLTNYEIEVLFSLIKNGSSTASELYQDAKIPYGRIYSVLNDLNAKQIIEIQDSRPKKYKSLNPKIIISKLLELKKRELDTKLNFFEETAEDLKETINSLSEKSLKTSNDVINFWKVVIGVGDILINTNTEFKKVKEEILIYGDVLEETFESKYHDIILNLIQIMISNLERGVHVKVLVGIKKEEIKRNLNQLKTIIESKILIKLFKYIGNQFEIRFIDLIHDKYNSIHVPFTIIDNETAIIKMRNPIDYSKFFSAIIMKNKKFTSSLKEKFSQLWNEGNPLTRFPLNSIA